MGSWDDYRKTCVHGIREELDYHDCVKCQEIAEKGGLKVVPKRETYIFTSQRQINRFLKKYRDQKSEEV